MALLHKTDKDHASAVSAAEANALAASIFVVSDDAQAILTELHLCPITGRQERILRTIASKYYQRGYCFARHATIAITVGCAKSTLQLDLDELEVRGLLSVQRRPKTSNVTILAPGLIEVLRIIRLERRRAEFVARSGVSRVSNRVESYKKLATAAMEELANFTRNTVAAATAKISEFNAPKVGVSARVLEKKTAEDFNFSFNRPKAVLQPKTLSTKLNSAKTSPDAQKEKLARELRESGVSPRQSRELVRTFGIERVELNLALKLHLNAKNPGGFLATAIRENYAASHVQPGSEAATVQLRERQQKLERKILTLKASGLCQPATPPPKPAIEIATAAFDKLPANERTVYEQRAHDMVIAAPPTWLAMILQRNGFEHPAVRGTIKAKAVDLWRLMTAGKFEHLGLANRR